MRKLGIPTVLDRFIQQAILQVLQPMFDPGFSQHSHGFRPGRRAHDAIVEALRYVQGGRRWVVDVDLEQFFDRVNHDVLMGKLAKRIDDSRLLRLIRRYLEAGMLANGVAMERHEGTPQGGPLSPLLANVLLDEVDKELEDRGHAFVRYADDCNVYVKTKRAGARVMGLLRQLYTRLKLRVNESKSAVDLATNRKLLGYSFWIAPGRVVKLRVAKKALAAMREQVRVITKRTGGRSMSRTIEELRSYLVGWKNYFHLARTLSVLARLDEWMRHRLRAIQLKHWRRGPTIYRELRARGLPEDAAARVAANARRWWRNSGMLIHIALPNSYFDELGATSTSWACPGSPRDLNSSNRPVRTRMPGGVAGVPGDHPGPLCRFAHQTTRFNFRGKAPHVSKRCSRTTSPRILNRKARRREGHPGAPGEVVAAPETSIWQVGRKTAEAQLAGWTLPRSPRKGGM
jgi:group II intron reverse transcriptase/maturase